MAKTLLERLEARFRLLTLMESPDNLQWKSPEILQQAFDSGKEVPAYRALMAIAGPCTPQSVWTRDWPNENLNGYQADMAATNGYVFRRGSPAPQWTPTEIHQAMRSQILKWANDEMRQSGSKAHGARRDPNALDDIAGTMHTELQKLIDREKDEGRILGGEKANGFVSFVTQSVRRAGGKGVGGSKEQTAARGRASELISTRQPAKARAIAARVQPPFDTEASNKISPGNPYGRFSPAVFTIANQLADALETGDRPGTQAAKERAQQLYDEISDSEIYVPGTHSGKKLIQTPHYADTPPQEIIDRYRQDPTSLSPEETDEYGPYFDRERLKRTKIDSVSGGRKEDGGDIDISAPPSLKHADDLDPDVIFNALKYGRMTRPEDLQHPKLARRNLKLLTDFDLRYLIRALALWLPNGKYPGKGVPGKDVELNPETGEPSRWVREGQPALHEPAEILASIARSGGGARAAAPAGDEGGEEAAPGGGGGGKLDDLIAALPPAQRIVMSIYKDMLQKNPKTTQKALADATPNPTTGGIGQSKVGIGKHITKACALMGMSHDEFKEFVQSGDEVSGGRAQGERVRVGKKTKWLPPEDPVVALKKQVETGGNPVAKFADWMKLYNDEMALDESVDRIDRGIVWRCNRAVQEYYYVTVLKPLMEGRPCV